MVKYKKYYEDGLYEEAWYDSSMIVYSKMVEDKFENKGDLTVVFNNGGTYQYKDVKFEDYVLLIAGGTSSSHGKAINSIIKGKYDYEKLANSDVSELRVRCDELITEELQKRSMSGETVE